MYKEITPYVNIAKPEQIGGIFEVPKLTIAHASLSEKCPLFKATFYEALRLSCKPWSIRKVASDVSISTKDPFQVDEAYCLQRGEYVTVPHELHMLDSKYFPEPDKFIPDRFIVHNEDGSRSIDTSMVSMVRPFGGGVDMCPGKVFAEIECLALVAGVLACWEFEPVGGQVDRPRNGQDSCSIQTKDRHKSEDPPEGLCVNF